MIVAPIVEMACRPLTAEQEAERKAHSDNSIKKKLGMPKQRICRQKSGSKGTSEIENILIIAVAIVELAGELGILEKLDRRRIKSQFGLSPKQITKARKIILDHWKARYSMGWVGAIPRKSSAQSRGDNISQAVNHIFNMLKDILPEDVASSIFKDVQRRIEVLGKARTVLLQQTLMLRCWSLHCFMRPYSNTDWKEVCSIKSLKLQTILVQALVLV